MQKIIEFFLVNARMNYVLFLFVFILGCISYTTTPKEAFPKIKENIIEIQGSYQGASIDNLNKMAVIKIEKNLKAIKGITKINTYIRSGDFFIIAKLNQHEDEKTILEKVKDALKIVKSDLPEDMDEPIASVSYFPYPLLELSISSNVYPKEELINFSNKFKNNILQIANISKVELNEDIKKYFEIKLDNKKIDLYGLNKQSLLNEIKSLSYIFPIGQVKQESQNIFLSTNNGAKSVKELLNTSIKVDDKLIILEDIASISKDYREKKVITYFNGEKNTRISIYKNDIANSIHISNEVNKAIKDFTKKNPNVSINVEFDDSILVTSRLNTVTSNILFGLILVACSIYLLINKRVAFIVTLGIPTAILIGLVILSFTSYTINMITLLGTLLVLGILVDDAVIISENIQRHMANGTNKLQSAILGTKEVLAPVLSSSLTTIFAFLPLMFISGELGQIFFMIPVTITILIIASFLESFVFLPLHAYHFYKPEDKERDWSCLKLKYKNLLYAILEYKKIFMFLFLFIIPALSFYIFDNMRYQMFLDFDEPRFTINARANDSLKINDTLEVAKVIDNKINELRKKLHIRTISLNAGVGLNKAGKRVQKANLFSFEIELEERISQNFVDKYITPFLAIEKNPRKKIREKSIQEIIEILREELNKIKPKEIVELSISKKGLGFMEHDIELNLSGVSDDILSEKINFFAKKLKDIEGVVFVSSIDNEKTKEIKIKVNKYGQNLGFSETSIANVLSSSFLDSTQTKGLDKNGIVEFKTVEKEKSSIEDIKDFELTIPNENKKIALRDIASFTYIFNENLMKKENSFTIKTISADVNFEIITPSEVLEKIEPILEELKQDGIKVSFGGEEEQNSLMRKELSYASIVSVFLIFITLLFLFNSFKNSFLVLSIIPFSILGALLGHLIMNINLSIHSFIGMIGLIGVVINDGIIMLDFIKKVDNLEELVQKSSLRLRPILITSITTFIGLSTLIFFASGQAVMLQPIAVSLGFGLLWGTILTLLFLPTLFAIINKIPYKEKNEN